MKKTLIVIVVFVVVLIAVIALLPLLIDANQFKPTLETKLTTALGRKVDIGNIQLAILSGGVRVDNVSIADDPAFSRTPFLTARQLTAGVALVPLIFSKKIEVSSFTVTDPQVTLLRSASGTWNFSSLGKTQAKSAPAGADPPATTSASTNDFSVGKLTISNGTMIVGNVGSSKRQTYQAVNLELSDFSYTSRFPFSLSAKTPGGGTLAVEGKAGPMDAEDVSLTPVDATLRVNHLDLASTGFVDPSTGLAGIVDFNGDLSSDGHSMKSKGAVQAQKVKLAAGGSPATVPLNVDYNTAYDLRRQTGNLTQGDVHIGKALAHLTGTYDTAGATTSVRMKLAGQGMPAPDLEGALPAIAVTLPSGASLTSGSLDVNLTIEGPVDKLVIAGPVNLSNAKLSGFNLKSKLGALSSFMGLGGGGGADTDIQTLSGNLRVDPAGTHADNLNVVVTSLGTVTGNANVSSTGQLNCKMAAKLAAGAGAAGALSSAMGSLMGGKGGQGGAIPFTITGTTSNPVFVPDVSGMAKGMLPGAGATSGAPSSVSGAASEVLGLFKKKKSN